jgi:hypothetical protein
MIRQENLVSSRCGATDRKLPGIRAVSVGVRSRTHRGATMPRTVTEFSAEFEKAIAALNEYQPRTVAEEKKIEAEYAAALDCCNKLCCRIVSTPAASIDECLLKIAAGEWGAGAALSDEVFRCLLSLRADLRRMQPAREGGPMPRAGGR